ncbi:hypothetical protein LOTGIDRAFT_116699 [Lottia gigantea]|uniref:EGF domain-specific O-linked N-acetylglucosamine transferase n=1 Tax=Lottia gigantea TaxID=225164 RepID=V4ALU8_LOTGI|nr:hypothetical protein LOTGIDRAFT_116699 [Lottia gigantea]ESO95735.1 hypothetical protein LOTGIDRAFT_116699 [Lottia gigantea]
MLGLSGVTGLWLVLLVTDILVSSASFWKELKLPKEHIPYYLYNNPHLQTNCSDDKSCPYKKLLKEKKCWGYEKDCPVENRMNFAVCDGVKNAWASTEKEQFDTFWKTADFGYVDKFKNEEKVYCRSKHKNGAYLKCSDFLRHCRAKNIFVHLKDVDFSNSRNRYQEDVGDVGGYCDVDKTAISKQSEHKSALQSWFAELGGYTSLKSDPFRNNNCDIIIDKPTYLIKLDAGINMFHHFCDFVNLYATMHINISFSLDVNIVMWDTSRMPYGDYFSETWKAFSKHPIINLSEYDGKKICFKDAVFSLLPRMRFGLYYNMPLIPGCAGSSLLKAFSQQVIHRLNIKQDGPLKDKIRITLLDRKSRYRNILNQQELVDAMSVLDGVEVDVVKYQHFFLYFREYPFPKQLKKSHNSDIFIGMHGAGLTHMLFQPDWGVGFELHNCDDLHCYNDLARLRGVKYMTWQKADKVFPEDEGHHPTLGAHPKFTNYEFDVEEFIRLVKIAIQHVKNHPEFRAARKLRHTSQPKIEL